MTVYDVSTEIAPASVDEMIAPVASVMCSGRAWWRLVDCFVLEHLINRLASRLVPSTLVEHAPRKN